MAYSERSINFAEVNQMLARDPQRLLDGLGLRYRKQGVLAYVQDGPASGKDSFCVWLNNGTYKDFASGRPKGDMIDLIGYVMGYRNQLDALKWAKSHLGLSDDPVARPSAEELARRDAEARARRAREAEDAAAKSERLHRFWKAMQPAKGTTADAYLRVGRNIPLDRLPHFPGSLRYQPLREHIDQTTGEVTEWPAMISLVNEAAGTKALGIHVTYLRPDGAAKAPVSPSKMMHGQIKGGVVRLSRGKGDLSGADMERKKLRAPLIIGEGIETCLTVACAVPEFRTWAALSLSNMALPWPAYASEVILLRENDQKQVAQAAFARVERHWQDLARQNNGRVRVVASRVGSDFNDWVRAGE